MLPGTRAYSDEDITEVVVDSIALFDEIRHNNSVHDLVLPTLFQNIVNMVSQRSIPAPLGALGNLPELRRKQ